MRTQLKIQGIGIIILMIAYLVSCTTTQEVKPKSDPMCNVEKRCLGSYDGGITQCPTKTFRCSGYCDVHKNR